MICPLCGCKGTKVIHGGMPMKLCNNDDCNCVWGFWSWWLSVVPFTGWLFLYRGSYLKALYHWLTFKEGEI